MRLFLLSPQPSCMLHRYKSTYSGSSYGYRFRNVITRKVSNSSKQEDASGKSNVAIAYKLTALALLVFGCSYASVPLYKVFCQMTGFGGTTQRADEIKAKTIKPVDGGRVIRVDFTANVHSTMPWKFKPAQQSVRVVPGETALAFYTVNNTTEKPITGVATYNVYPPKAGLYFNKIQCFCFEEQRLNAKEEVDMPVFFFLDPELLDDPSMSNVNTITLSYTFFKTDNDEEAAPAHVATKPFTGTTTPTTPATNRVYTPMDNAVAISSAITTKKA